MENPELLRIAAQQDSARGPAAYPGGRLRRRRAAPDNWLGVWQTIFDGLRFDVEFPFSDAQDDDQSDNASEVQRREAQEWDQRYIFPKAHVSHAVTRHAKKHLSKLSRPVGFLSQIIELVVRYARAEVHRR